LNFGEHEGLHFDNLPNLEKARFADPNFKANGGESWAEVRLRTQ
jgi:broad specificity phosphatase PhoE